VSKSTAEQQQLITNHPLWTRFNQVTSFMAVTALFVTRQKNRVTAKMIANTAANVPYKQKRTHALWALCITVT